MIHFQIDLVSKVENAINGKMKQVLTFEPHHFSIAQAVFQTLCSRPDTVECVLFADNVKLCDLEEYRFAASNMRRAQGNSPIMTPNL